MATHKQLMVEIPVTDRGMGTSHSSALAAAFSASPIHAGDVDDAWLKELGQKLLLDGEVVGGYCFSSFFRDYDDAPVIADVDIGAANIPSPFVPNVTSPGPGSMNASDMPPPPDGFGLAPPGDQFGSGVGSQLDPSASSASMKTGVLNDWPLGSSPGTG